MIIYRFTLSLFFMSILFLTSGCSSLQPLDTRLSKQEIVQKINIGDQLEIETSSGERRLIHVLSKSETHIESATGDRFELEEIKIISHREYTIGEKTVDATSLVTGVPVTSNMESNKVFLTTILILLLALYAGL